MTLDSRSLRTVSLGGRIVKVPDTSELTNYTTAEDFDSSAEPVRSDTVRRVSVASIANPATELAAYAGDSVGALLVAYKTDAATNEFTVYSWDSADSGGADVPYVVAGSSGYWVACGGRYSKSAITVKGKGRKTREVFAPRINLLLNFTPFTISQRYLLTTLARATERAGKHLTFHGLRHTFASESLRGGVGLRELQAVMGHSDIETTEIYLHAERGCPQAYLRLWQEKGLS